MGKHFAFKNMCVIVCVYSTVFLSCCWPTKVKTLGLNLSFGDDKNLWNNGVQDSASRPNPGLQHSPLHAGAWRGSILSTNQSTKLLASPEHESTQTLDVFGIQNIEWYYVNNFNFQYTSFSMFMKILWRKRCPFPSTSLAKKKMQKRTAELAFRAGTEFKL